MDQYSRRVLGWSLNRVRGAHLTRAAFDQAFRRRRPLRLIFQSDRGNEYAAPGFRDRLSALGVRQSMTRGGTPGDNAHAESFFHSFKADVIHGVEFSSDRSLRACVQGYRATTTTGVCTRHWATGRRLSTKGRSRRKWRVYKIEGRSRRLVNFGASHLFPSVGRTSEDRACRRPPCRTNGAPRAELSWA